MSRHITIAVAEPSLIIRSGILSVLKRLPAININLIEIGDLSKIGAQLCRQKPDILIVNPAVIGFYSIQNIRSEASCSRLKCLAMQSAMTDRSTLESYDGTISVYDTAEQIREKLLALTHEEDIPSESGDVLSNREKEIISFVVKGMTNRQIADQLNISTHTVITHRRNIASKLQIHSTAGLTIYAIVNKLVQLDDIEK